MLLWMHCIVNVVGVIVNVLHCWYCYWFVILLVLLMVFVVLLVTHINQSPHIVGSCHFCCMCFGEVLPSLPLFCKWCIGGLLHCCTPFATKYTPHHFLSLLLMLFLICHIVSATIGPLLHVPWWGTTPTHCVIHVVEHLCDWKQKGKKSLSIIFLVFWFFGFFFQEVFFLGSWMTSLLFFFFFFKFF